LKAVCLISLCLSVSVVETKLMESPLFLNDLLTDREPGIPGGETPAATDACFIGKLDIAESADATLSTIRARDRVLAE
jgi:hypothetical protein